MRGDAAEKAMNSKHKWYVVMLKTLGVDPFPVTFARAEIFLFASCFGTERGTKTSMGYLKEARHYAATHGLGGFNSINRDEWQLLNQLAKQISKKFPHSERVSPPVGADELRKVLALYDDDDPEQAAAKCRILFQRVLAARKTMGLTHATAGALTRKALCYKVLLEDWKFKQNRAGAELTVKWLPKKDRDICFLYQTEKFYKKHYGCDFTTRLWELKDAGKMDTDMLELPDHLAGSKTEQTRRKREMWAEFRRRCELVGIPKMDGEGEFSSKSLRSGFVKDALDAGYTLEQIRVMTRHASTWGARKYARMMESRQDEMMVDALCGVKRTGPGRSRARPVEFDNDEGADVTFARW